MAKLHIICGNCGCNDCFEYKHSEDLVGQNDESKQWKTDLALRGKLKPN